MIEINIVREKYASMPDSELISFATNERHQLTPDGTALLDEELLRRKLTPALFKQLVTSPDPNYETNNYSLHPSINYAFDEKENGKSDQLILEGLAELGMEETIAGQLLLQLEPVANQRLKKAERELLIGLAILSSGIAITFLPLSMPANRITYIIAWCAILLGALKFVKGVFNKGRFKKIIKNIMLEVN